MILILNATIRKLIPKKATSSLNLYANIRQKVAFVDRRAGK
ncbi:hypothetical protein AsAng_0011820 [Aureispira anguillae]|uniref:Uncharacterized protein n=1 Tax=Aureispira anguillae TaxID=2864201 RepID=A0A915YCD6_9BACT|nr:hypothetical protein AsAng_0011820 [Aureispira anguillae]